MLKALIGYVHRNVRKIMEIERLEKIFALLKKMLNEKDSFQFVINVHKKNISKDVEIKDKISVE
jgi:UDP-N-acetylglucosamine 2-epimerase